MKMRDLAGTGSTERGIDRIDRRSVSHQLLGKNRIGHTLEWINNARERRVQD
jgi:hypothetical protein